MFLKAQEFLDQKNKAVTFIGMSGLGKTTWGNLLENYGWYHYSADYRIGTEYIQKHIVENVAEKASKIPFLKDLMGKGTIKIENNIRIDDISPITSFLGIVGNPEKGAWEYNIFLERQRLYRDAEIQAIYDLPLFIRKAEKDYKKTNFIHDTAGSFCELDDQKALDTTAASTLILYIEATKDDEEELFNRSIKTPKPLLYNEKFFKDKLNEFMEIHSLDYVALIDPDQFYRWLFPQLFQSRIPKYKKIANEYGYTVTSEEMKQVKTEQDFLDLVCTAIKRRKD